MADMLIKPIQTKPILSDHHYWIIIDGTGRITLRNCHFLRKVEFQTTSTPILSAMPEPTGDVPVMYPNSSISTSNDAHATVGHPMRGTHTSWLQWIHCMPSRVPRALFYLFLHKIVGPKELSAPHMVLLSCGRGRGEMSEQEGIISLEADWHEY